MELQEFDGNKKIKGSWNMKKLIVLFFVLAIPLVAFSQSLVDNVVECSNRIESTVDDIGAVARMVQRGKQTIDSSGNQIRESFTNTEKSNMRTGAIPKATAVAGWADCLNTLVSTGSNTCSCFDPTPTPTPTP